MLAGGRSTRMGAAKASLEWHGSTLLHRIAGLVGRLDGPVVVVRAPGQALPRLPGGVVALDDAREGRGPLQGMLAGFEALEGGAEVAFVCSTDVPLLHPRFVARVLAGLGEGVDAAVPRTAGVPHPLAAAYRTSLLPELRRRAGAGRLRVSLLIESHPVAWLDAATLLADARLRAVDPSLASLRNLNAPADYAAARRLPAPRVRVERGGDPPLRVRAATLGAAAAATGFALDAQAVVAVDGDPAAPDPELPLAEGDVVALSVRAGGA